MLQRMQNVDRRVIYYLLLALCIYALLNPMGLPISIGEDADNCFAGIGRLEAGEVLGLAVEITPATIPELVPALEAVLKLAFSRGVRILTWATAIEGAATSGPKVHAIADSFGKTYGVDYVHLGYRPGIEVAMQALVSDIWSACAGIDQYGTALTDLPMMQDVLAMTDVSALFLFTGGLEPPNYIKIMGDPLNIPIYLSTTAVGAPRVMPYVSSGQLSGLLNGMRGAAELEILVKSPGSAVAGMDAQSLAHVLIVFFIVLGNIGYIVEKRQRQTGGDRR